MNIQVWLKVLMTCRLRIIFILSKAPENTEALEGIQMCRKFALFRRGRCRCHRHHRNFSRSVLIKLFWHLPLIHLQAMSSIFFQTYCSVEIGLFFSCFRSFKTIFNLEKNPVNWSSIRTRVIGVEDDHADNILDSF